MNQTVGQRIWVLRKKKNLTQEELANLLSVSGQAVSKWEQDRSCPDILQLPTLAKILGVTVDELLTGEAPDVAEPIHEIDEYEDRVVQLNVISQGWFQTARLPLARIENVDSLREYFPKDTFTALRMPLENAVLLAKQGELGTLFSHHAEPFMVVLHVELIGDSDEEDEEE